MKRTLLAIAAVALSGIGALVYLALKALAEWAEAENPATWDRPNPNEECCW